MGVRTALASSLALLVLMFSANAGAQAVPDGIPRDLEPWVAWVIHDSPDIVCPLLTGRRTCAWPGQLDVSATPEGATFELEVHADRETEFALPGSDEHWPQDVRLDFRPATIVDIGGQPHVRVGSGRHRISGAFTWPSMPEVLSVPSTVAQVNLRLDGEALPRPRIDAGGRLWLRDGSADGAGESETDSVRASIYRRVEDGVPMVVTTRLRLNVSGRAREVQLGDILLAQSRPVEVRADIPVQVATDGQTKVYVRPGTHDVEIDAVIANVVEEIAVPSAGPDFYDPQEVWIWAPNEAVRSVQLSGLTSVDPERTSLPSDWGGYTTYLAEPGKTLSFDVTRRGVEERQPNVLQLERDLWLDLDGTGYTVRDQLSGTLHQGWRLDYGTSGGATLGRVSQGTENLLITEAPSTSVPGVELRDANIDLTAEVRLEEARSDLAIVGWNHDVQQLGATLHLPPGWTLLGGKGVDSMDGTWLSSWTLWDFFFVLIIALVVGRLFGWPWGVVGFLALVIAHGQQGAPEWVWIHLIASLALLRVLPKGWWRKAVVLYRAGALVALVIIFAPFAHDQVLAALHPQVGSAKHHSSTSSAGFKARDEAPAAALIEEEAEYDIDVDYRLESNSVGGRAASKKVPAQPQESTGKGYRGELQQVDPSAVVQTGPGLPNWSWSSWNLSWTGPVRKDHSIQLYLLSPWANRGLGLLRVLLLLALAMLLLAPRDMYWERKRPAPRWWRTLFGTGAAFLLASIVVPSVPAPANAQEPASPAMLSELRKRVIEENSCPSPCVVASDVEITVDGLELQMRADVSAAKLAGWTLPGPQDALRIESVRVDGRPTTQLRRDGNGMTAVRLDPGAHTVELVGTLADRNVVTLQFEEQTRPKHISFASTTWTVDGISPNGVPDNSIQLTRIAEAATEPEDAASGAVELPPWYQVERLVALGMPWQIHTTVTRRDASRPQLVKVQLVDGEKVMTEGIRVEGRDALVDFGRDVSSVTFTSEIAIAPNVKLTAPTGVPWTETWKIDCSRIWRCGFSDLPPVSTVDGGVWRPVWKPWPGESLEISVAKPTGAEGQPKTVQDVEYVVTPGKRLMQATLDMNIRASQGGWQPVTLPGDAELQSVTINGQNRTIRPQEGVVRLPVQPGETSIELKWQQPWERSFIERVPQVDIGSTAANARVEIHRGGERWLLGVRNSGLTWGPAILFWPHLLILLLLALVLTTIPRVPVAMHEWLLLAIGLSQLPVPVMLPIVFWFVVIAWRRETDIDSWWRFDVAQLGIVMLTVIALGALYGAIHTNLLIDVDMQVAGQNSNNLNLRWYTDRVESTLPTPAILSVPLLVWRGLMFFWALWLVTRLIAWARWGWEGFSKFGWWKFPKPRDGRRKRRDPDGTTEPADTSRPRIDPGSVSRNAVDGRLVHVEIPLGGESRTKESDVTAEVDIEWSGEDVVSTAPRDRKVEDGLSEDISDAWETGSTSPGQQSDGEEDDVDLDKDEPVEDELVDDEPIDDPEADQSEAREEQTPDSSDESDEELSEDSEGVDEEPTKDLRSPEGLHPVDDDADEEE